MKSDLTLQHSGGGMGRLSQALFNASVDLNPHQIEAAVFGKGFDERNLRHMRAFFETFPIWNAVRSKLSWTHYRLLTRVESEEARLWYMNEAAIQNWSSRALERQIGTLSPQGNPELQSLVVILKALVCATLALLRERMPSFSNLRSASSARFFFSICCTSARNSSDKIESPGSGCRQRPICPQSRSRPPHG